MQTDEPRETPIEAPLSNEETRQRLEAIERVLNSLVVEESTALAAPPSYKSD